MVASAAYRAGVSLVDARQGMTWDYTRRQTVEHARILAPEGAPSWVQDRGLLWNAVEAAEKRKDSQLAREIQLTLPDELGLEDQVQLLEGWVDRECVALGMVADVALHADKGNPHGHVLLTLRPLAGEAFGAKARDWNRPELLEGWRESWAGAVNTALAQQGFRARVDHRSLAAQGIDREPKNLGRAAWEMERRGEPSRQGEAQRERQRERDRKRQEKRHAARTRRTDEPEALDLTWALGLDPSAVALDGGRGRGRAGESLGELGQLAGPELAGAAGGAGALGGADAPGAGGDPGAGVVGAGVGAGADLPAPAAGEPTGAPVLAAPAPAGAPGGPAVAAPVKQPRGPVRETLSWEAVYAQAEDVKAYANELGRGLTQERACVSEEGLDEDLAARLRNANPLLLPPVEGCEILRNEDEDREVYEFTPQTPRTLPGEVEALAWAIKEPEEEPVLAEELARQAYGLEERPEEHYGRPWADRREDLVQDGLRLAAARTAELQEVAEHQAVNHVSRLWVRLQDAMDKVSRWGHDLVATWKLSRAVRKVERDVAAFGGPDFRTEPLSRDPAALQKLLQERQEAAQKASEASRRQWEARKAPERPKEPQKGKGRGLSD